MATQSLPGFPPSVACAGSGMNPNTFRMLRRDSVLSLEQDEFRNDHLRAHSVLTFSDIVKMRVLQRMIEAGLSVKRFGAAAAAKAGAASMALRERAEHEQDPAAWLIIRELDETPVVGPFRSAGLMDALIAGGGAGFAIHVDVINEEVAGRLEAIGAMRRGPDGSLYVRPRFSGGEE